MSFSASQLDTFGLVGQDPEAEGGARGCPRKWAWEKIAGVPKRTNAAAAFGSRVHKIIEEYILYGHPIPLTTPEGACAMGGYAYIQPLRVARLSGESVKIEDNFNLRLGHHTIMGIKDVETSDMVTDWKTTKDVRYALTAHQLRHENVQAALYAAEALQRRPSVNLRWVYLKSSPPHRALPVIAEGVTMAEVAPTLYRAQQTCDLMGALKRARVHPLSLPPNLAECERYGGCGYVSNCQLTDQQKFEATLTSAEQMLAQMQQAVNPPPNGAPPSGPPTQTPENTPPAAGWAWIRQPSRGSWEQAPETWIAAHAEPGTVRYGQAPAPSAPTTPTNGVRELPSSQPLPQGVPYIGAGPDGTILVDPGSGVIWNETKRAVLYDPRPVVGHTPAAKFETPPPGSPAPIVYTPPAPPVPTPAIPAAFVMPASMAPATPPAEGPKKRGRPPKNTSAGAPPSVAGAIDAEKFDARARLVAAAVSMVEALADLVEEGAAS